MERNIRLYPWFRFLLSLIFWQAVWFLYFQETLSAAEAILLYVVFDLSTTVLEVPLGYLSDKIGRRQTLILAGVCGAGAAVLQIGTDNFALFAAANVLLGASMALQSGTDSAFLYESLAACDRDDEAEAQELRAWRASFAALALSACTGGLLAVIGFAWVYVATALAFFGASIIALGFTEPPRTNISTDSDWRALRRSFAVPDLRWLFGLAVAAYGFSHVMFVFGQPFIDTTLDRLGLATFTPLVSGVIVTCMMALSLLASTKVPALRDRFSAKTLLLAAFLAQVLIITGMALSGTVALFALLALRMVPDAFITPLRNAQIQKRVDGQMRATYVSVQSLAGRLGFAICLTIAAGNASPGEMMQPELQAILWGFSALGAAVFALLWFGSRRLG